MSTRNLRILLGSLFIVGWWVLFWYKSPLASINYPSTPLGLTLQDTGKNLAETGLLLISESWTNILNNTSAIVTEAAQSWNTGTIIYESWNIKIIREEWESKEAFLKDVKKATNDDGIKMADFCVWDWEGGLTIPVGTSYTIQWLPNRLSGDSEITIWAYDTDFVKEYCKNEYSQTLKYINNWFPINTASTIKNSACQDHPVLGWASCLIIKDLWYRIIPWIAQIHFYISSSPQDVVIQGLLWFAVKNGTIFIIKDGYLGQTTSDYDFYGAKGNRADVEYQKKCVSSKKWCSDDWGLEYALSDTEINNHIQESLLRATNLMKYIK